MAIEEDMKDPKALPKGFESPMKNKEFIEQFHRYLNWKVDNITFLLKNPEDMISHQEYLNLLMMYTMHRKLFKTKDEERDVYKKIWSLQKLCPFIIIYNNLKVSPGIFLSNICPLSKKSSSLDPKDVKVFLFENLKARDAEFSNQISQYYMRLIEWIMKMNSDSLRSEPRGDIR
jgi:WASH complex subunit 7